MREKAVSGIMLTVLLICMLTLAFNIQPVKAGGTIYIRADGGVDPPTAPIQRDGDVYTFADNIYTDSIVIEKDNIVIDGNGFILNTTVGMRGFDISYRNNVTVKNTKIMKFNDGVYVYHSNSCKILNNIVTDCWYAIDVMHSSNNNTVFGNFVNNSYGGISVDYSSNGNTVTNNTVTDSKYLGWGLYLWASSGNVFSDNIAINNSKGMDVQYAFDNSIHCNNISGNQRGVYLSYSSNNTISENNITNNYDGMGLDSSSNNSIGGNNITNNDYGLCLAYSSNNIIAGNNITANNEYGIYLAGSSDNTIYHNNFKNNTKQVYDVSWDFPQYYFPSINVWDDGYPSGGNYWSDYAGVDAKSGSSQDLHGSDGIGDTPYVIDVNNRDHYPLMYSYGAPPPPAYALTITTTVGGTTDPAPGTYSYTANSSVQVTAIAEAGYLFDYWELDSVNVSSANPYTVLMDNNHTLKAFFSPIPPPLSASISPLSTSINVGQSVTFTSTVSGGYTPYSYQWYLNGNPVSGATSSTWTFTPTTSGIYYVHLKVTDAKGNTAQSETSRITVAAVPVGGYSMPIQVPTKAEPIIPYVALIAILTTIFVEVKRKTNRKH